MQKAVTTQSSIDYREINEANKSSIDNRVKGIHSKLQQQLRDESYELGYTYKIMKKFSENEIYQVSEYCTRKANNPGRAFVAIFEKKLRAM